MSLHTLCVKLFRIPCHVKWAHFKYKTMRGWNVGHTKAKSAMWNSMFATWKSYWPCERHVENQVGHAKDIIIYTWNPYISPCYISEGHVESESQIGHITWKSIWPQCDTRGHVKHEESVFGGWTLGAGAILTIWRGQVGHVKKGPCWPCEGSYITHYLVYDTRRLRRGACMVGGETTTWEVDR